MSVEGAADRAAREPTGLPEQALHNWRDAHVRAERYLQALGEAPDAARDVALDAVARAWDQLGMPLHARATDRFRSAGLAEGGYPADAISTTLASARELVMGAGPGSDPDGGGFLRWRVDRLLGTPPPSSRVRGPRMQDASSPLRSAPPLARGQVVPHRILRRGLRRWIVPSREEEDRDPIAQASTQRIRIRARRRHTPWVRAAHRRRAALALLVTLPSVVAAIAMATALPRRGNGALEIALAAVYGLLFAWLSLGFWTAFMGLFVLARRKHRFGVSAAEADAAPPIPPGVRTAILMPICNEPVDRVFAGLRAIRTHLDRAGLLDRFDFFVLSDSPDPSVRVDEELAWYEWCRDQGAFDDVFYRHRRARVERKSGNVADFCRRYGAAYRYMIVLDADSVMTAGCLERLVRLMEVHPEVGLIQTAPVSVGRRTPFARSQQFASRLYGPLFAAGLHFWQLGDGQYWGHNAILRVAAFMEHCALPRLPGSPPFGGEILSHDFVEAALMGSGGYSLWLAHDLEGSYEETPSNLVAEMGRDRRWCQGNLQHLQLLTTRGLVGAHRALFLNGVMSYLSAGLWFVFLILSTSLVVRDAVSPPSYFPAERTLFPEWPVWHVGRTVALVVATVVLLFLPKLLGLARVVVFQRSAREWGGVLRLVLGVVLESIAAALLAPVRMLFHTRFVARNLVGRTVEWRSPDRRDQQTTWGEALRRHGVDAALAVAWGGLVLWVDPRAFLWFTPVVVAIAAAAPVSVWSSRIALGDWLRRRGWLAIPEDYAPPEELLTMGRELREAERRRGQRPEVERDGFVHAVVDPVANAVHCALRRRDRHLRPSIRIARDSLLARALASGPAALSDGDRTVLLTDSERMERLHRLVWDIPRWERARLWGRPGAE